MSGLIPRPGRTLFVRVVGCGSPVDVEVRVESASAEFSVRALALALASAGGGGCAPVVRVFDRAPADWSAAEFEGVAV